MSASEATSTIATYAQAEQFLLSLVNYEQLPPPMTHDAEGWHLREFSAFLGRLGNPQEGLSIIHIAGTKGKGSTTRMVSGLLSAQGLKRVGSFTSPHIESFRERICVDNALVSESDFVEALEAVRRVLPERTGEGFRTTFEVLTAMALWHFRKMKCEAVVLESGLGGRLDSTNATLAKVALLTTMGLEHQRVLGSTLRAIAGEKAGIIKPGTGVAIVGPQMARRVRTVVEAASERAGRNDVPLRVYGKENDVVARAEPKPWGFELDLRIEGRDLKGVRFHCLGSHQLDNLRAAWMAVEAFGQLQGRAIDAEKVRVGVEGFRSPGRLEQVCSEPLVLVDSAHCPTSARAVVEACVTHFGERGIVLVLGLMKDKKPQPILHNFSRGGQVSGLFTHTPPSPRARQSEDLAGLARGLFPHVEATGNVEQALEAAWAYRNKHADSLILVSGTTYSISAARRWVRERAAR